MQPPERPVISPADARHLYVHVPFCRTKCAYCAFDSTAGNPPGSFVEDLAAELHGLAPGGLELRTVFFGGGTPSALGTLALEQLCRAVMDASREGAPPPMEWTVEANPGTLEPGMAGRLRACGVTRISIGAQSFDPAALAVLGRTHEPESVRDAVRNARSAGISAVALDLIAGVPGLDQRAWRRTLDEAVALEPEHVSVYALTVEPGTPLAEAVADGRLRMPGDDAQMEALAVAESLLSSRGFRRYEISNYSREGFECRHNLAVWRGEDYLGAGPAAASRWGLCRRTNDPDPDAWHAALAAGRRPPCREERLGVQEDAVERWLTGIRLSEGLSPAPTGTTGGSREKALRRLSGLGLVEGLESGRWRLTCRGREVADAVMRDLLAD